MDVAEFTDALTRVAAGGTALDPEVVTQTAGRELYRPHKALKPG